MRYDGSCHAGSIQWRGLVSGVLFSFEERNSICLQDSYWLVRGRS